MKKLILPIILLLIGTGSGVGAAFLLKTPEEDVEMAKECACAEQAEPTEVAATTDAEPLEPTTEFAKMANQFVVPIVDDDTVVAMVVLSLSIEVALGNKDVIFQTEPKLRDAFLQVMFDHANIGGFSGNFTTASNMRILRQELNRAAKTVLGANAIDVLILDIVRQDV